MYYMIFSSFCTHNRNFMEERLKTFCSRMWQRRRILTSTLSFTTLSFILHYFNTFSLYYKKLFQYCVSKFICQVPVSCTQYCKNFVRFILVMYIKNLFMFWKCYKLYLILTYTIFYYFLFNVVVFYLFSKNISFMIGKLKKRTAISPKGLRRSGHQDIQIAPR